MIRPTMRLLTAALALVALPAAAADWTVVPGASRLGVEAMQGGQTFEGRFERFDAAIAFDPADPAAARVTVTIDMTSFASGAPDRDGQLPTAPWFDAATFPEARFEVAGFTAKGGDAYEAAARLTIRDVTADVTLPFTLTIDGATAHASGELTIDRTAFGVGQGQWAAPNPVGHAVKVIVDVTATSG
jgi:polyisoprenoid-binding protein YceI